mmetsp:Transcript_22878/g.26077  ORF Transcript_22878/g.26077 Transcript_22878/m.26077 type:complete len:454 (-) Transcript_22878:58-1419(-)
MLLRTVSSLQIRRVRQGSCRFRQQKILKLLSTTSMQKKALKALGNKSSQNNNASKRNKINTEKKEKESVFPANSPHEGVDSMQEAIIITEKNVEKEGLDSKNEHLGPTPSTTRSPLGQLHEFAPKIVVAGVGGAGGNALNNMIAKGLKGVDFLALNTDAQHLSTTLTDQRLQLGVELTRGLGCGANPDAGQKAAEECRAEIEACLSDAHMLFITAGMGGGTGTGAAPVVADIGYNMGILTVAVVTLPFTFEGTHRRRLALEGVQRLQEVVDTIIVIPNQNLFSLATPETGFVEAFGMADDVLLGGVKSITDLMTSPGLINLDFADVQSVMHGMGNALLGTGIASGDDRCLEAAKLALDNPLLLGSSHNSNKSINKYNNDDNNKNKDAIATAKGMLVNITGGSDMTLFEVDEAAQFITNHIIDQEANIIFGSAYDESLKGSIRVSVVATGIDHE